MARSSLLNLNDADRQALLDEIARTFDPKVRRSCEAVLRLSEGLSRSAVAAEMAVHPTTVGRWARRFRRLGLRGLTGQPAVRRGRPAKVSSEQLDLLCNMALSSPGAFGKPFERWTLQRLTRCFVQETGLSIRPNSVGLLLRRKGVRWSHGGVEFKSRGAFPPLAGILWVSVAVLRGHGSAVVDSPRPVLWIAVNLASGHVTQLQTAGRTPDAFLQFLERVFQEHLEQRLVLIAESGFIRMTKRISRFLVLQARKVEAVLISRHPGKHEGFEAARSTKRGIAYLFNSPAALVSRISKALHEVEVQLQ
jgi:transposase